MCVCVKKLTNTTNMSETESCQTSHMRRLPLIATLLLGGAVSAAADMSDMSFANAHPARLVPNSKPSLLVRDASGSGLPVHQPPHVTEKFTDPMLEVIPSRLKRADLENLHEDCAPALSASISILSGRRSL